MGTDTEGQILRRAMLRGMIQPAILKDLAVIEPGQSRIQILINRGHLDATAVELLKREIANEKITPPLESAPDSGSRSPESFSRYRQLEFIGQGGMAKVYKAYDPLLGRYVALKFLREDNPLFSQRLLVEARAQARIEHDHVCKIYEVGRAEGRVFISMQFIKGRSLRDLVKELSLRDKVRLMKTVAEAVHAAHQAGLVHRDLKPANIMVERNDDATYVPYVLDFGLAREIEAPGLTLTGTVVGSPYYMSPEQAMGVVHKLDPRSDIYSLGVTLYEVLTGMFPFDGLNSVEVLLKLFDEDPVPLRKRIPALPEDLETIVMKCLEKEPAARYGSAKLFADDLERYLTGLPILAHRPSLAYRVKKRILLHKTAAVAMAFALLVILFLSALSIRERINAQRRAELSRQISQEVKEMETVLRFGHTMPLHDLRQEKTIVVERIRNLESRMQEFGESGYGPAQYALGRGHLALRDYGKARKHLEAAWESGYQSSEVAYSLGLTLGELYKNALREIERISSRELRNEELMRAERAFRRPALRFLRSGSANTVEATSYVEGLIAFYAKDYGQALTKTQEAVGKAPWLYEAYALRGEVYRAMANEKREIGDSPGPMSEYRLARNAYQKAASIGESDPVPHEGLCSMWVDVMEMEFFGKGGDLKPYLQDAVSACNAALTADSSRPEPYRALSHAYRFWGQYQLDHGLDPAEAFESASQTARQAVTIAPENGAAHDDLGVALWLKGKQEMSQGRDPTDNLNRSIKSHREAVRLQRGRWFTYNNLATSLRTLGSYQMRQGKDPLESLREATQALNTALQLGPDDSYSYSTLGNTYVVTSEYESAHGMDPKPSLIRAVDCYEKAVKLNPNFSIVWNNLGYAHVALVRDSVANGGETTPHDQEAERALKKAKEINPTYPLTYFNTGILYGVLAQQKSFSNQDPRQQLEKSEASFNEGLAINSRIAEAFIEKTTLHIVEARWALQSNTSPSTGLDKGFASVSKALELDPSFADAYRRLGELLIVKSRQTMIQGRNPEKMISEAEARLRKAMELQSGDAMALALLAEAFSLRAEMQIKQGQAPDRDVEQGLETIQRALSINPRLAEAMAFEGVLYNLMARYHRKDDSRTQYAEKSRAAFDRAFSINKYLRNRYGNPGFVGRASLPAGDLTQ